MKFVRSAVVVAAALAVPLMPTAAQANRYVHTDAANDVLSSVGSSSTTTPEPTRAAGDILRTTIVHKAHKVILRIAYHDLVANDEINAHLFIIKTSKMRRDVTVVAAQGAYGGRVIMAKPNGKHVKCAVTRHLDYARNTATVVVPRSCLGNPRWVRVGMAGLSFTGFGDTDTEYIDDAQTNGTLGLAPKYSPKVFR